MLYTKYVIDDAEKTLVIILAAALAVLLVLSILVVYKFIQLLNTLKGLAEKAEHVADVAEGLTGGWSKTLGSFAVGRILRKAFNTMMHQSSNGKRGK